MNLRSGFELRIVWYILFSGGKAGATGGAMLGFFVALFSGIEEIIRFDQSNGLLLLILFPYLMLIGAVIGLLVGIIIGLVFALIISIYWPIETIALKKYCLAIGAIISAIYPLTWFAANVRMGNHSEYIEIGLSFILLVLIGYYTGFSAWKTFMDRMTLL